jgi:hypothetical protein
MFKLLAVVAFEDNQQTGSVESGRWNAQRQIEHWLYSRNSDYAAVGQLWANCIILRRGEKRDCESGIVRLRGKAVR